MASVDDIPDEYLAITRKPDFKEWVSGLPVPLHVKRELCSFWQKATGDALGADFWDSLNKYGPN